MKKTSEPKNSRLKTRGPAKAGGTCLLLKETVIFKR